MATKKSSVPASKKHPTGTKPSTTKKATPTNYDDAPILSRPLGSEWHSFGIASSLNSALAEQAAAEHSDSDEFDTPSILTELSSAPMYRLLAAVLKSSVAKSDDPDWETALFASLLRRSQDIRSRWIAKTDQRT